jgi:hypothetical protein
MEIKNTKTPEEEIPNDEDENKSDVRDSIASTADDNDGSDDVVSKGIN